MTDLATIDFNNLPAGITRLDVAEAWIIANGGGIEPDWANPVLAPVVHRFTPGLYSREIYMVAGSVLTSRRHRHEHPFVILQGRVSVFNEADNTAVELSAPYHGTTPAGTKRLLFIHEDTIWTTFHPTDITDMGELEAFLFDDRPNPMLAAPLEIRHE